MRYVIAMKHYVVFRSERGLKVYLVPNRGFAIHKDVALSWGNRADAEAWAMNKACVDPGLIGKLEVVCEGEGDNQDLSRFSMADLAFIFGDDVRTDIGVVRRA